MNPDQPARSSSSVIAERRSYRAAGRPITLRPHAPEHALEVELPFLQMLLASFQIVPLVVGDAAAQSVAEVLRILGGGPETLIVVSSDLSHYHGYETARRLDAATAAAIERGDWVSLRPDQACGCLAVAGLLIEASRRGPTAERLALCNSEDTAGSRQRRRLWRMDVRLGRAVKLRECCGHQPHASAEIVASALICSPGFP